MENMFFNCKTLNCDFSSWNVHNVINMSSMFERCIKFEGKGLEKWDVSNAINMKYMFYDCKKFEGKGLENWNVSNVKYMKKMFNGYTSIKNKPSWYKE